MNANDLKSGKQITTKRNKEGKITGWIGYPSPKFVRVEWKDGKVWDYLPEKLIRTIKTLS